mgnify:CR=1 FL=1
MYQDYFNENIIYEDPIVLIEGDDGLISSNLLFEPTKLISIKDYSLKNNIDESLFIIDGRRIILKDINSNIPYLTKDNVTLKDIPSGVETLTGVLFTESPNLYKYRINFSYEHENPKLSLMAKKGRFLPNTKRILNSQKTLNYLVYGDSISVGCSSTEFLNIEPFEKIFPIGFMDELKKKYSININYTNTSVGGMDSIWGIKNVYENAVKYNPDLVIIGFGMNDGTAKLNPLTFKENIKGIIDEVRGKNASSEFILISTIIPNINTGFLGLQEDYLPILLELEKEYNGVIVLNMTHYYKELWKYKNSFELLSNNINHPSDFGVRLYVKSLLTLIEE